LIPSGAHQSGDRDVECDSACVRTFWSAEARQQFSGSARDDIQFGRLVPGLARADLRLREVASLHFLTVRRRRNGFISSVSGSDATCGKGSRKRRRHLLWHRLTPLLLSVLQIEVSPSGPVRAGGRGLDNLDKLVSCQFGLPGTPRDIPVHLLAADGHRRRHNRLLAAVCRKEPRSWPSICSAGAVSVSLTALHPEALGGHEWIGATGIWLAIVDAFRTQFAN